MKTRKSGLKFMLIVACLFTLVGCAPDATDIYGRPINISNYRGKWVVINYWATWCGPCMQEIPELNQLATNYKNDVVVLGVNYDGLNNTVLRSLAQGYQVQYYFLKAFPISKWGENPKSLPVTYIIDPKGNLYKTLLGPQTLANFQAAMNLPNISYD